MGTWLINWEERGPSGPVNDSFLWHCNNLYIMDNHRLALWCWWQHLDRSPNGWNFLHIDRHYDAMWQAEHIWVNHQQLHRQDLDAFREAKFRDAGTEMNLHRWDVMTGALKRLDGEKIHNWVFATADEGSRLEIPGLESLDPWQLQRHLKFMAESSHEDLPTIVDVDIDYFTYQGRDGRFGRVFSDQYISDLGLALFEGLQSHRFGIVTVALSPTTTGSWQLAEELLGVLLQEHPCFAEFQTGAPNQNQ